MKKHIFIVTAVLCICTAAAGPAVAGAWEDFEKPLFGLVNDSMKCGFFDTVMPVVSELGNTWYQLGILGVFWVGGGRRTRRTVEICLAGLGGIAVAGTAIKYLVNRPRPPAVYGTDVNVLGPVLNEHSFPSGHTMSAWVIATVVAERHPRLKTLMYTLAGLVAFSRVYMGVHFPTDVIAGAVIGYAGGRWSLRMLDRAAETGT